MPGILDSVTIRGHEIRNRIVMPPIVCFGWSTEEGFPDERLIEHYRRRSASGIGLVIVEAVCVLPEGRLAVPQLGLWEDSQIAGLRRIADAIHEGGAVALVQLHHAGRVAADSASSDPAGPSAWEATPAGASQHSVRRFSGRARALTSMEIDSIREAFVQAAVRAEAAAFDGIELHAAHGYLLSQMASPLANLRTDRYGGSPENRTRLTCEILSDMKERIRPGNPGFILSARVGGNEPDYVHGVDAAKRYETAGLDLIHVSSGISAGDPPPVPYTAPIVPEGFAFNTVVYGASLIRRQVGIPVIAVNDIRTLERGDELIRDGHADMAAYCRPLLADPDWAAKSIAGIAPNPCRMCSGGCRWFKAAGNCPGSGVRR